MSKIKLEGNASGTGTLTISAPSTNTDRSLTLPDGAGEILLSDGDGSNLTGITTGKVLQMVSTTFRGQVTTMSSSWTALPDNLSITPQSTTSKLFVTVQGGTVFFRNAQFGWQIFRDGSQTAGTTDDWQGFVHNSSSSNIQIPVTVSCVVTSGSTTATNFKVYTKGSGDYSRWSNNSNDERLFTIMEVEV